MLIAMRPIQVEKEMKELSKHFNIQRQPFGYKRFTKKEG